MRARHVVAAALVALVLSAQAGAGQLDLRGVLDGNIPNHAARAAPFLDQIDATSTMGWIWWDAGDTRLSAAEHVYIDRMSNLGTSVVLAITSRQGQNTTKPRTVTTRDQFCAFVQDAARHRPRAIAVHNEPNRVGFFGSATNAPRDYVRLLANCYPKIKAVSPNTAVAGPSLAANDEPGRFIRSMGNAYRSAGLARRILDVYSHHAYPASGTERADTPHSGTRISMGDVGDLRVALRDAWANTVQASVPQVIWWTETGVAGVNEGPSFLTGNTDPIGWYARAYRLAACQTAVRGFLGFQLVSDQPGGWQTGLLRSDWTPKGDLSRIRAAVEEMKAGTVNCAMFAAGVK